MSRALPAVHAAITAPRDPERRGVGASHAPGRNRGVVEAPRHGPPARRAMVAEPCPRSRAAIEHALVHEGYELVDGEGASEAPVLLFAGSGDGLHVLEARDVACALEDISEFPGPSRCHGSVALGIHAFVPRPFGLADVLRVARAVEGFDFRRRVPEIWTRDASHPVGPGQSFPARR